MSLDKERMYIAAIALALATTAFLAVMLWAERAEDPRLILSVDDGEISMRGDGG